MSTALPSRPQVSLRRLLVLTMGFAVSFALLAMSETYASATLDVLALMGLAACTVCVVSKYANSFRGRGYNSIGFGLAVLLFVLTTRGPARAFWGGFQFSLATGTLIALHPFTPAVLGALAAVALAQEFSVRRRNATVGFPWSAAPIAMGVGIAYGLALLRPFVQMLRNL